MKNILMLGTGGTIASVPSADGLIPALDGKAMLELVPELEEVCTITCKEILNLDSSNLEPRHWQLIAEAIAAEYANYDGFVVTHGTHAKKLYTENFNGFASIDRKSVV